MSTEHVPVTNPPPDPNSDLAGYYYYALEYDAPIPPYCPHCYLVLDYFNQPHECDGDEPV